MPSATRELVLAAAHLVVEGVVCIGCAHIGEPSGGSYVRGERARRQWVRRQVVRGLRQLDEHLADAVPPSAPG